MNFSFLGPAFQILAEIEAADASHAVGVNIPVVLPDIFTYLGRKHVKISITFEELP